MKKRHTICLAAALALMAQIPGAYAMRADSQNDELVRTRVSELHALLKDMNTMVDMAGRVMTADEQEKYRHQCIVDPMCETVFQMQACKIGTDLSMPKVRVGIAPI